MKNIKYLVGVDEAGRGPLAGPVAVGIACVPYNFDWDLIPGVGDSKKVSEKNREAIFLHARKLKKEQKINFHVALISARVIDRKGIVSAVQQGILICFKKLNLDPHTTEIKLDGLLHAPEIFTHQETIIKGDQKEKIIGLASIMAKVTRDAYMKKISRQYPVYAFEVHKGYGTKVHRSMIRAHGLSTVHRQTFTRKVME